MYDIYIKNYLNSSGVFTTTETKLYSVPITSTYQDNVLIDPVVRTEMGKTGTLEFSIRQNNPYYSCWKQMRTIIRVVYDGTTIFRGRALTIDNTIDGAKKLHFEGDMAFLLDTHQPETKEENRTEISVLTYLQQLINKHNSEMDDGPSEDKNDHKFALGNVPGQYASGITDAMRVKTDANKKYGVDSRTTTMSALEELQNEYGGYFRTRYVNGTTYIDWLDTWFNPTINPQEMEISGNLIDLSDSSEVDNIFTAVVPIGGGNGKEITIEGYKEDIHGHNDRILVPQIVSQFSDSELNKGYHTKSDYQNAVNEYGIIYKVQKFDNADTQQKLWEYCLDWIKDNYVKGVVNYTITAVDMHHLDGYVQKYLVGDRVKLIYPDPDQMGTNPGATIEKNVTITDITYNLHNPEKNSYSVGTPNNLIQKKYGSANGSKKSSGGGGGVRSPNEEEQRQDFEEIVRATSYNAWNSIINTKNNSPIYNSIIETYGPEAGEAAQRFTYTLWMKKATQQDDPEETQPETALFKMIPAIEICAENARINFLDKLPFNLGKQKMQEIIEKRDMNMEFAESVIIDGYNRGIFIKEPVDTDIFPLTEEGYSRYCAQVDLYGKPNILEFGSTEFADNPLGRIVGGTIKAFNTISDPLVSWATGKKKTNTATVDGKNGYFDGIAALFGSDGTGEMEKVSTVVDGVNAALKMFSPDDSSTDKDPTVTIEGEDASAVFAVQSGDPTTINKTITYTGSDGRIHTITGGIKATDFYDTTIGSLNANLINVNDLVVNHTALIANLQAGVANIRELFSDYAKISELSAKIAQIPTLTGIAARFSGNVSCSGLIADHAYISSSGTSQDLSKAVKYVLRTSAEGAINTTLEVQHFDGTKEELTFKRAAVPNMTGSWSGGTVQIKNANDPNSPVYYRASVYQGAVTQDSTNPNYYSGNIVYSTTGQNTYNTGATYFIDATSRYNAGRNSVKTIKPTNLGVGQQGTSLGTLSGVSPGKTVHIKVGDTFYYFLCT